MTVFQGVPRYATPRPCAVCGHKTTNQRICAGCFRRSPGLAQQANSNRRDAMDALRIMKEASGK